jgi:hypothetical protein
MERTGDPGRSQNPRTAILRPQQNKCPTNQPASPPTASTYVP